jgi:hypothetical protein
MRLLTYAGLDLSRVRAPFEKLRAAIERDDFRSADVKKLVGAPYYRAKLDYADRLLLQFVRHGQEVVCLALEVIAQHAYDKSRFLRGARVDESHIEDAGTAEAATAAAPVRYLHPGRSDFHLLDKVISFDETQDAIYRAAAPLVVVGSAGSGKTALTLEKLRQVEGSVLYVTHSAYLAQSARGLYCAHGYENDAQEAEFLSYREFLETLAVPAGREVDFARFRAWFERHRQTHRFADAHPLFEEFRGVIGSRAEGVLSAEAYRALGARESIFPPEHRDAVHALFGKYRAWLCEDGLFDSNLVAHEWQALAAPTYDFVVVDEVQDLTCAQLALVLKMLRKPGQFLLCGDSNQIVHPNFFSWAAVKSLFWRDPELAQRQRLSVLRVNYRNAPEVTAIANRVLKIKHARFASIDRESNFLVDAATGTGGEVRCLPDTEAVRRELDGKTRRSAEFAVLVLRDEDKPAARQCFGTPLVFAVHEAKGLEYRGIILYNVVSGQRRAYAEICEGVEPGDLEVAELPYRRARDKADKSAEAYKFYVNALYVALTRAVERVYLVERDTDHPLLALLGVVSSEAAVTLQARTSSREEWEREAHRLEQQGKHEQAQAIRSDVLQTRQVPWPVWGRVSIEEAEIKAYDPKQVSSKARQLLFDYALWHGQEQHLERLAARARMTEARQFISGSRDLGRATYRALVDRYRGPFAKRNFKETLSHCDQYGVDHRTVVDATPLMLAAAAGNVALIDALLERGAEIELRDSYGWNALAYAFDIAVRDAAYARDVFGAIYERVAPLVLDVEVEGRLVRLHRQQGEYFVLQAMLAGLKLLASRMLLTEGHEPWRRHGFYADYLMRNVQHFPHAVLREERKRRTWFNAVLARAEVESSYLPARRLWRRVWNGHYLPNPAMQLRVLSGEGRTEWRPVYEVLDLAAVARGHAPGPIVRQFERILAGGGGHRRSGWLGPVERP